MTKEIIPKFLIIIPCKDEEDYIGLTLQTLIKQSLPATKIIVVDDNSKDATAIIVKKLATENINVHYFLKPKDNSIRASGGKIVSNFNYAIHQVTTSDYDYICKFDADLSFPKDYLSAINDAVRKGKNIGMCGGTCIIDKHSEWIDEKVSKSDHLRGALKCYTRSCFEKINGLDEILGWDTLDEYKARFYGYEIKIINDLKVKHHRVTNYTSKSISLHRRHGEMFYNIGYNPFVALLSCFKRGIKMKPYVIGFLVSYYAYLKSLIQGKPRVVNKALARHINQYRFSQILKS